MNRREDGPSAMPAGGFAPAGDRIIRFDRPAPALAEVLTGYKIYGAFGPTAIGEVNWFLPETASINIAIDAGPIAVTTRTRTYSPIPQVSLFGSTSRAMRTVTNGGLMIGVGVSAIGWSRLFCQPADRYRDRIVPLAEVMGDAVARQFAQRLAASDRGAGVKPVLDEIFQSVLRPVHGDAPIIRAVMAEMLGDGTDRLGDFATRLDIDAARLRRITTRHFGFPPKLLMTRARFLHTFSDLFDTTGAIDYGRISSRYFDLPHFLRDANAFLGMTPKRFMQQETGFLRAALHARAVALGSAIQLLHHAAEPVRAHPDTTIKSATTLDAPPPAT